MIFPHAVKRRSNILLLKNIFKIFIPYSNITSDKLIFALRSLGKIVRTPMITCTAQNAEAGQLKT